MAKVSLSIRLKNDKILDQETNKEINLESLLPWSEIAKATYQATFKPYFSDHEVVLSICEPEEIRSLNNLYRNIDKVTDVLSFNSIGNLNEDLAKFQDLVEEGTGKIEDAVLGDIVICLEVAQRQALEKKHSLKQELRFLFVHGLLHLLGYDHETDIEEKEMFGLQDKIIKMLNLQSLPGARFSRTKDEII